MSDAYLNRSNSEYQINRLLMLNSLRQIIRRTLPSRIIKAILLMALLTYGVGIFSITNGAFDSYRGLHLSARDSVWFLINIYLSSVSLIGLILAHTFQPLFAHATEAIAALPLSMSTWYSPQLRRFSVGLCSILFVTWGAVSFALWNIFELDMSVGYALICAVVLLNALTFAPLLSTITVVIFNKNADLKVLAPVVYSVFIAVWILYVRTHQDSTIRDISNYISENQALSGISCLVTAGLISVLTSFFLRNYKKRYHLRPLTLPPSNRRTSLILRLTPMPPSLSAKLAMATLRGIILDRKNIAIIASSYLMFAGFAIAARLLNTPGINSLILSAAALYFPLFMALVFIFTRSTLGARLHTIYVKPIEANLIVLSQYIAAILTATVVTILILISLILIVGNQLDPIELAVISLNTACVTAIACMSGNLLRASPRDQPGIIASVIFTLVLQGAYQAFLGRSALAAHIEAALKIEILALLIVTSILIEKLINKNVLSRHV